MADPKAENALREAAATLEELEARWSAARQYLNIDEGRLRHKELSVEVADPHLWDDQDRAREVTTQLGRLANDLEAFDGLRRSLDDSLVLADFSRETLATGDVDWSLLDELSQTVTQLERSLDELEMLSLLSGPYDQNDAIAELHAGAGGTDAQDWTEMLLRMYSRWAERRGFGVEIDEVTEGQEAGLLSATFIVKGRYAYGWLSTERGVHRLVRMSPFDSQARRQTSFASIDITPLLDEDAGEVEIDEKDLRVDTYRSSGAGGQHVNKTDSAIRITHLPDGDRRQLSERTQPASEPRARHADTRGQAGRARQRRTSGRDGRAERCSQRQRVGLADPQLRPGAVSTWSRIIARTTRPATSTRCSTAISTASWRPNCADNARVPKTLS
jgi:peptide chain release factor 2